MFIERDGKQYELTEDELVKAWNEFHSIQTKWDVRDAFDYYSTESESFKKWREEHETDANEMIDEAHDSCIFHEEMYGSFDVYEIVWETIEEHELDELFE
jgi:hypothetical protein